MLVKEENRILQRGLEQDIMRQIKAKTQIYEGD